MNFFDNSGHLRPELKPVDEIFAEEDERLAEGMLQAELYGDLSQDDIDIKLYQHLQEHRDLLQNLGHTGLRAVS
jgi:hypothetical protein